MNSKIKALGVALMAIGAFAACSDENAQLMPGTGSEVTVTFTAGLPGSDSRAAGDGLTATTLSYAVFNTEGDLLVAKDNVATFADLTANVDITLVDGVTYVIGFWADASASPYTFDTATGTVTVDYGTAGTPELSNNEARDAFFKTITYTVDGTAPDAVVMQRPLAQLNFGTTDYYDALALGAEVLKSGVVLTGTVPNTLDLFNGEAKGEATVAFDLNTLPDYGPNPLDLNGVAMAAENGPALLKVGSALYHHLSMNYVLVPAQGATFDVTLNTDNVDRTAETPFTNVPLRRNFRTNILGALLTNSIDFTIEIDEAIKDRADQNIMETGSSDVVYNALRTGGAVKLTQDVVIEKSIITQGITNVSSSIDLNGHTLKFVCTNPDNKSYMLRISHNTRIFNGNIYFMPPSQEFVTLFEVTTGGTLTMTDVNMEVPDCYGVNANGGDVRITSGTYAVACTCVQLQSPESTVSIEGGYFKSIVPYKFLLNVIDRILDEIPEDGGFQVSGGDFEDFNPSKAGTEPAGKNDNFCAAGYSAEIVPGSNPVVYRVGKNVNPTVNADGNWEISEPAVFANVMTNLITGEPSTIPAKIILTADIDMKGIEYKHSALGYNGPHMTRRIVLEGGGHTISNLEVSGLQAAMFPWTASGFEVSGLKITDSKFIANNSNSDYCCAAVFGSFCDYSGVKITDVEIDNVEVGNAKYVGGLIATNYNKNSMIENCVIRNSKLTSAYEDDNTYKGHCGGFVGQYHGTIQNCGIENVVFDVQGNRGGIFVGTAQAECVIGSGNWMSNITGLTGAIGSVDNRTDKTTNIEVRD